MKVGDKIPLQCQTANYDNSQFARAVVRDASGDEITDSPFDLTPDADGFYTNDEAVMPDSPWVSVDIKFYDDSGYTTLSSSQGGTDYVVFSTSVGDNFPQNTNIVGVVEPDGCSLSPIQDTIVQGCDRTLSVRLVETPSGNPFDLTDATLVAFRFRKSDGTVLSIDSDDAGSPVQIVNAAAGKVLCTLTDTQTGELATGIPTPFSIVVTQPSGVTVVNCPTQLAVEEQDV